MTLLILVGGFLGAGKTTLLQAAALRLRARGRSVGLITNDQAADLVDTGLLRAAGLGVREVARSCFCCDFPGLLAAARELRRDLRVDTVIAEPVGSCTDLSATIVQPFKARHADEFTCAPLSVLCDAARVAQCLDDGAGVHRDVAYIYRTQVSEADILVLGKSDMLDAAAAAAARARIERAFPGKPVHLVSARTGAGIDGWLDAVQAGGVAGARLATVDYDVYANGEAALGWLNGEFMLVSAQSQDWRAFASAFMERSRSRCRALSAPIGHLKLLLHAGSAGMVTANVVGTDAAVDTRGTADVRSRESRLIVNARVELPPEDLEHIIRDTLAETAGTGIAIQVVGVHSLKPGRPVPTHRYATVV